MLQKVDSVTEETFVSRLLRRSGFEVDISEYITWQQDNRKKVVALQIINVLFCLCEMPIANYGTKCK